MKHSKKEEKERESYNNEQFTNENTKDRRIPER
jgi:hypothetical protein